MQIERLILPVPLRDGDAGIRRQHAIEDAAWIWHPERPPAPCALRFRCCFHSDGEPLVIHLSADERYTAYCDGQRFSRGPHRGDIQHWSFSSYRLELTAGEHELMVVVTSLGDLAPGAQLSYGGGFILRAEGAADAALSTGTAPWRVAWSRGLSATPTPDVCQLYVGGEHATTWPPELDPVEAVEPVVLRPGIRDNPYGQAQVCWRLRPSPLPDMLDAEIRPGGPVAAGSETDGGWLRAAHGTEAALAPWLPLFAGQALTLPAKRRAFVLWDLGRYHCGYPQLACRGGAGARIAWRWAEALFDEAPDPQHGRRIKGDRAAWCGKFYFGAGDSWRPCSDKPQRWSPPWWRAGRFCLIEIEAGPQELELSGLSIAETRYPLSWTGSFVCDDERLPAVLAICERVLQSCAHETYMDCPYYEQLMYVGDTRLQVLVTMVMTGDDRLPLRALELFDWSRVHFGVANERYPSRAPQHCMTFALIFVLMLRDVSLWRRRPAFINARMPGLRAQMEQFPPWLNRDGLLEGLPGWSFMDWVPVWHRADVGCPPDGRYGVSASINLLYVLALQAAAALEEQAGEGLLAERYRRQAAAVAEAVVRRFWDAERGLIADDLPGGSGRGRAAPAVNPVDAAAREGDAEAVVAEGRSYSEHAQCLALLAGILDEADAARCYEGLCTASDLHRCTVYFQHYLFETHALMGQAERILPALDFWKAMVDQGFTTTVESPEPARSDCHAWGAHPLYHCYASLAGIRPAAPGFAQVRVAPQPGGLRHLAGSLPHPDGVIAFDLHFSTEGCTGHIDLPEGVAGTWQYAGETKDLRGGGNSL